MDNSVIAIGGAECGESPVMPYIGAKFRGSEFTELCKLYLEAALLRCDFDVLDMPRPIDDAQDMAIQVNRHTADGAVLITLDAFGSRKSFNDFCGGSVRYCNRRGVRSKTFCEDICSHLCQTLKSDTADGGTLWQAVGCPSAVVSAGYLTNFTDAKRAFDPDFAVDVAEHIAMGICEHFGMPYVKRDDILAYPLLCSAATGKRGKKIKMLQALLSANGYKVAIDGVYGKATDAAVKTAAKDCGMPDDGVTAALWRDLLLLNFPPLKLNAKNAAVLYVQRKLFSKLYNVPRDGVLGEQTLSALGSYLQDAESGVHVAPNTVIDDTIIKLLAPVGGGKPRLF